MRAKHNSLRVLLAVVVTAVVVPLGFALSLPPESHPLPVAIHIGPNTATSIISSGPMLGAAPSAANGTERGVVPDAAELLLVGTMLLGLAAAVRWAAASREL